MFARLSRPHARVLFSKPAVIAPHEGVPTLMFRVANERGNQIMEAEISVSLARQRVTREGQIMMHPIDEHSPLHGATRASLLEQQAEIVVLLSGTDETYGAKIYARHSSIPHDMHWDKRFADILTTGANGRRILDLANFHELHEPKAQVME